MISGLAAYAISLIAVLLAGPRIASLATACAHLHTARPTPVARAFETSGYQIVATLTLVLHAPQTERLPQKQLSDQVTANSIGLISCAKRATASVKASASKITNGVAKSTQVELVRCGAVMRFVGPQRALLECAHA